MSEVSKLYSSKNIYGNRSRRDVTKDKHGDVKHIVFKDGKPVMTEIIRVGRKEEEQKQRTPGGTRRIRAPRQGGGRRATSEEALRKKKQKLADRLKKAIYQSLTLWSEREKIWISYQGGKNFLVKRFGSADNQLDSRMMTLDEIVESEIPNILETGWEVM